MSAEPQDKAYPRLVAGLASMTSFHPLSQIFPLLEGKAFDELVADVRENGVREPLWMYEGRILDGRNRARAADAAGREAPTREYTGSDPLQFVLSLNLHRRHLDESQRSVVAAKLANLHEGRPGTASKEAVSQAHAAEVMKVSRSSVQRARKVIEKAAPEVVRAVERGELDVSAAAAIVKAPKAEQVSAVTHGKQAVRALGKKIKGGSAPAPKSGKELAETNAHRAYTALVAFRHAILNHWVTPKAIVALDSWICLPNREVAIFVAKAGKLSRVAARRAEKTRRRLRAQLASKAERGAARFRALGPLSTKAAGRKMAPRKAPGHRCEEGHAQAGAKRALTYPHRVSAVEPIELQELERSSERPASENAAHE